MAEQTDGEQGALQQNPVLQGLDGCLSHILGQMTCKSKEDVIQELVTEIDLYLITESREKLFRSAVGAYDTQMDSNGLKAGKANLELKNRRGDAAHEKCARDVVELALYACGLVGEFPREVLGSRSTYIEITSGNQSANGSTEPVDEIKVWDCGCKAEIKILRDECDKHHKALCLLK